MAESQRQQQHLFPQGQRGGLSLYAVSGIVSGCEVTVSSLAGGRASFDLAIAAGKLRLDGLLITTPALAGVTITPTVAVPDAATTSYDIYVVPTRKVPALTAAPGSPANGDIYALVTNQGAYQMVQSFQKYNGSAWAEYNPISHPMEDFGHNGQPLNTVTPTLVEANFSLTPEKEVYLQNAYPVYTMSPSNAKFRHDASFKIATVSLTVASGTLSSSVVKMNDSAYLSI